MFLRCERTSFLVKHERRSGGSVGGVDVADVSELRGDRPDDTPPGHADVRVWLRGPRRPRRVRDVPETSSERREFRLANETRSVSSTPDRRSKVDGTACMPQVGRPRMVGVTTLSPSQRGAYEPASCLRGPVVDTPSARKPRRSRRGGCHCESSIDRVCNAAHTTEPRTEGHLRLDIQGAAAAPSSESCASGVTTRSSYGNTGFFARPTASNLTTPRASSVVNS